MNTFGLGIGIATLIITGLGFPLVIQGERRLGLLWWPYMLGSGILIVIASLFVRSDGLAAILGVLGATFIWGSTELKGQAVRAELGWFPFGDQKPRPPLAKIIEKWKAPHL